MILKVIAGLAVDVWYIKY